MRKNDMLKLKASYATDVFVDDELYVCIRQFQEREVVEYVRLSAQQLQPVIDALIHLKAVMTEDAIGDDEQVAVDEQGS